MKLFFILGIFLTFISLTYSFDPTAQKVDVEELKRLSQKNNYNNQAGSIEIPVFVYFHFRKDRQIDFEYYKRIIEQFLSTVGITINYAHVENNSLMGYVPKGSYVDKEALEETFSDVLESVEVMQEK